MTRDNSYPSATLAFVFAALLLGTSLVPLVGSKAPVTDDPNFPVEELEVTHTPELTANAAQLVARTVERGAEEVLVLDANLRDDQPDSQTNEWVSLTVDLADSTGTRATAPGLAAFAVDYTRASPADEGLLVRGTLTGGAWTFVVKNGLNVDCDPSPCDALSTRFIFSNIALMSDDLRAANAFRLAMTVNFTATAAGDVVTPVVPANGVVFRAPPAIPGGLSNPTLSDGPDDPFPGTQVTLVGVPVALAIVDGPASGVAGEPLTPALQVEAVDDLGRRVGDDAIDVTVTADGTGILSGGSATTADGLATFSSLTYTKAEAIVLTASATGLTSVASSSITIAAGPAAQVVIDCPPSGIVGADVTCTAIGAFDSVGNPVSMPGLTYHATDANGAELDLDGDGTFTMPTAVEDGPVAVTADADNGASVNTESVVVNPIFTVTFSPTDGYISPRNPDAMLSPINHRRLDFSVDLVEASTVTVRVLGPAPGTSVVKTILNNAAKPAGVFTNQWDGRNQLSMDVAPGTYSLWVRAVNAETGDVTERTITPDIVVDRTGPTFSVIATGSPFNAGDLVPLTLTFGEPLEAEPNAGVSVAVAQPGGCSGTLSDLTRVDDWTYTAAYAVASGPGCTSGSASVSVTGVDRPTNPLDLDPSTAGFQTTLPDVFTLDFVVPGAPSVTLVNNPDEASGTAAEPYGEVFVRFFTTDTDSDGDVDQDDAESSAGSYPVGAAGEWGPASVPDARLVCAYQVDAAGNSGEASETCTSAGLDNVPPSISSLVASPDPFSPGVSGATTISFNVDEEVTYTALVKQGEAVVRDLTFAGPLVANDLAPASFEWNGLNDAEPPTLVGSGTYTVVVSATDQYGNVGTSSTTVVVDVDAPTLQLQSVSPAVASALAGDVVTLRFTADESLAGNPGIVVGATAAAFQSRSGLTYEYAWTATGASGAKPIGITSGTDTAGNTLALDVNGLQVVVDATAPTGVVVLAQNDEGTADTVTVDVTENALPLGARALTVGLYADAGHTTLLQSFLLEATAAESAADPWMKSTPALSIGDNLHASVCVLLTDEAGNEQSLGCAANDVVDPVLTVLTPPDGRISPGPTNPSPGDDDEAEIEFSISEDSHVTIVALDPNGVQHGTPIMDAAVTGGTPTTRVWSGIVDGEAPQNGLYTLVLTTTDAAGNSASGQFEVVVDNVVPTATLSVSPAFGDGKAYVNEQLLTVLLTVDEAALVGAPVVTVEGVAPTGSSSSAVDADTTTFTYTFNSVGLGADGAKTIDVTGEDTAGNDLSITDATKVVVDRTAPVFGLGSPAAVTTRVEEAYDLEATLADDNVDTIACTVGVNAGTPVPATAVGAGAFSRSYTAGTLASSGTYTYDCADAAGNGVTSAPTTLRIDPGPLSAVAIVPANPALMVTGALTFDANGVDAHGNDVDTNTVLGTMACTWASLGTTPPGSFAGADFTAGTRSGFFQNKIQVTCGQGGEPTRAQLTSVTLTPGPVHSIAISPDPVDVVAGTSLAFSAVARDEHNNIIPSQAFDWSTASPADAISEVGVFQARTSPTATTGPSPDPSNGPTSVSVCPDGVSLPDSRCDTGIVHVVAGPLATVTVSADDLTSPGTQVAGTTEDYDVSATDQHGNPVGASCSFSSALGTIGAADGTLAASTSAPASGAVVATCTLDGVTQVGEHALDLVADVATHVHVLDQEGADVASINVPDGGSQDFGTLFHDQHHNVATFDETACGWSATAGSIDTATGAFTASGALVAGDTLTVTLNCGAIEDTMAVTIVPSALDHVAVTLTESDADLNNLAGDGNVRPGSAIVLDVEARDADGSTIPDADVTFGWTGEGIAPGETGSSVTLASPTAAGEYSYCASATQGDITADEVCVTLTVLGPQIDVALPDPERFNQHATNGAWTTLTITLDRDVDLTVLIGTVDGDGVFTTTRDLFFGSFPVPAGAVSPEWDGTDDNGVVAPDGTYVVRVLATDANGNSAENDDRFVILDSTAPSLAFTGLPTHWGAGARQVVVSSLEPLAAAPTVEITTSGGSPVAATLVSSVGDSYTYSYTVSGGADGVASIDAAATDLAGNAGTLAGTIVIDTIAPAFDPALPTTVTVTAGDADQVISVTAVDASDVTVAFSGVTCDATTPTGPAGTFTCELPTLTDATNDDAAFTVTLTDAAGNFVSDSATLDVVANTLASFAVTDAYTGDGPHDVSADVESIALTIQAQDAFGNPISDSVAVALIPTGGSVADSSVTLDGFGQAAVVLVPSDVAGVSNSLRVEKADDSGKVGVSATFNTIPGAPKTVTLTTPTTDVSADPHSATFTALVKDRKGNPTPDVAVTFTSLGGGFDGTDEDLASLGHQVTTGAAGTAVATLATSTVAGTEHHVSATIDPNNVVARVFAVAADTQFEDLMDLSFAAFYETGGCGGGAPRIQVGIDQTGDGTTDGYVHAYAGNAPSFDGCATGAWIEHDLLDGVARFDISAFTGGWTLVTQSGAHAALDPAHRVTKAVVVWDAYWMAWGPSEVFTDDVQVTGATPVPSATATLSVVVVPGAPASVTVETPASAIEVSADVAQTTLVARVLDQWANPVPDAVVTLAPSNSGTILGTDEDAAAGHQALTAADGRVTRQLETSRVAGTTYTVAFSVAALLETSPSVTVVPGAASSVTLSIPSTTLSADDVAAGFDVAATVRDAHGNALPDGTPVTFAVSDPGAANTGGALPADVASVISGSAGVADATFSLGSTVAGDDFGFTATSGVASNAVVPVVTIVPGALHHVDVAVTLLEDADANGQLAPGEQAQLTAIPEDQFGNARSDGPASWTIVDTAGPAHNHGIDASGLFTAGDKAGTFAVQADIGGFAGSADVAVQSLTAQVTSVSPATITPATPGGGDDFSTISYTLDRAATVTVEVFDGPDASTATLVRVVLNAKPRSAGLNEVIWDGRGQDTLVVADGTYWIRVSAVDTTPYANVGEDFDTTIAVA